MTNNVPEEIENEIERRIRQADSVSALARELGINKGHISLARKGYVSPKLRIALGLPNLKPAQTCTCGEVHTVPWCTNKKGAPVPEGEKEIVYVEVQPEPKPKKRKRPPQEKRYRMSYECGRGENGRERRDEVSAWLERNGWDSLTDAVNQLMNWEELYR